MRITYNLDHRHAICLKFRDTFLTSLKKLLLKTEAIICSTIEANTTSILSQAFDIFVIVIITNNICITKKHWSQKELLALQLNHIPFKKRLLKGTHSVLGIELPCFLSCIEIST